MGVKEYLEKRIGQSMGVVRSGFPKEVLHNGKLLRIECDIAVLEDEKGQEWAIPVDKVLLISPSDVDDAERPAGFQRD